jgi:hypothetical protein
VVRDTSAQLTGIDAATVDLTFSGSTAPATDGGERPALGFRMQGPFDLGTGTALPVAELRYTRLAGTASDEVTFLSTGTAAFVRTPAGTFAVPQDRLAGLGLPKGGTKGGALGKLDLTTWFVDPKVARDGDDDVITGRLRPDTAFGDLAAMAGRLGVPDTADLDQLAEQDRARLERAIASSSIRLVTGHDDDVLRSLDLRADLAPDVDDDLRQALGRLAGARIELHLRLSAVGREVHVEAPTGAKPLP